MRIVGLDLGSRKIAFCEVQQGKVVARDMLSGVQGLAKHLGPNTPPARVIIEACREAWFLHAQLTQWGHEVALLDTTRAKQIGIGQHGRKTDKIDAEVLALALEQGRVPLAHLLSEQRQDLRNQIGIRRTLVQARAEFVTTARGLARAHGHKLPSCGAEKLTSKIEQAQLPEATRTMLEPLFATLRVLNEQIDQVDRKLHAMCANDPIVQLLCTVVGVNIIVAASFVSVIDEAKRFNNGHQVASYLGLVPCEDTTGGRRRLGAITKQGNSYLRANLVQAAWVILRHPDPNNPLKRWGMMVAERRGDRIAVVAVARKLATTLYAMWRDGACFDPAYLAHKQARGLELQAQDAQLRARAMQQAARKLRRTLPKPIPLEVRAV